MSGTTGFDYAAMTVAEVQVRPAAMKISAGLADPRMRIGIEVTARKRADDE